MQTNSRTIRSTEVVAFKFSCLLYGVIYYSLVSNASLFEEKETILISFVYSHNIIII